MKHIAYVHGLNSSHRSFSYIVSQLPRHNPILIDYNSHQPLLKSVQQVISSLPDNDSLCIVGHSLGGLIATLVASEKQDRISKLVTISSPLRGSRAASTLRWLPGSLPVFQDIMPKSVPIVKLSSLMLTIPTVSIISTGGHLPSSIEPNDSVVTVSSQKALLFGEKIEVKASHFEVLMHEQTIRTLRDFLFEEETASCQV